MKEKLKRIILKRETIIILILLVVTVISLSYAYFMSADETGRNIATTECLKLIFSDRNDINLESAYPLSEQEGSQLTPYEFTIRNVCNTQEDYQVNIETLSTSTLDTEYLRIKLGNEESKILKRYELNESNVNQNVKEGRKIATGTLRSNEEITYNLRLWIDEASTVAQSANKEYYGKVTISSTLKSSVHDVEIAYIVDGVTQNTPPEKSQGYILTNLSCTNATGEWNDVNWKLSISDLGSNVKCSLTFDNSSNYQIIELNPNGGFLAEQYIKGTIREQLGTLPTPIKTGYTFEGWYKESTFTNKVESTTVVDSSLTTLYAKYNENTTTINTLGESNVLDYAKANFTLPSGYIATSSISSVTPTISGAPFNSGVVNMSSGGYAYNSKVESYDYSNPTATAYGSRAAGSTITVATPSRAKLILWNRTRYGDEDGVTATYIFDVVNNRGFVMYYTKSTSSFTLTPYLTNSHFTITNSSVTAQCPDQTTRNFLAVWC